MSVMSRNQSPGGDRRCPAATQLPDIFRQLAALCEDERKQLLELLQRMVDLDEELADVHLCLPTLAITFYLLDKDPVQSTSLRPQQLLAMLEVATQRAVRPR